MSAQTHIGQLHYPTKTQGTSQKMGQGDCNRKRKCKIVSSGQDNCSHELRAPVIAYMRSAQNQAGQHSGMKGLGAQEPSILTDELLTVDGFLRGRATFL